MKAKEKARSLMNMFEGDIKCTLICVDEIIEALEHNSWQNKDWINHYKEVKQEINKL
jgi:hypothetical protein